MEADLKELVISFVYLYLIELGHSASPKQLYCVKWQYTTIVNPRV